MSSLYDFCFSHSPLLIELIMHEATVRNIVIVANHSYMHLVCSKYVQLPFAIPVHMLLKSSTSLMTVNALQLFWHVT